MIAFPKTWAQAYNPSYPENTFMCQMTKENCSQGRFSVPMYNVYDFYNAKEECIRLSYQSGAMMCMAWHNGGRQPTLRYMCQLTEINCTSAGRYSIELSARDSFEAQKECRLLSRRTNHQFCMVWIK